MRYSQLAPDFKLAAVERMATSFPDSKTDPKQTPALEEPFDSQAQMVQ
jgi:hypothetical protein